MNGTLLAFGAIFLIMFIILLIRPDWVRGKK